MYWYDKPTETAIGEMAEHIEKLRGNCPYIYALMDPSMEMELVGALAGKLSSPPMRLYEGLYDGEGMERVDPYLVGIQSKDEAIVLSEALAGVPALSFIGAALDPEYMRAHLRAHLEARSADGQIFLLRWADTRALRALRDVLDEVQWAKVMTGLSAWWSFDRKGEPVCFSSDDNPSGAIGAPTKLRLNPGQMTRFEVAMAADLMLGFIHDHAHVYGEFTQRISYAQCHAIADELVGIGSLERSSRDDHNSTGLEKIYDALHSRGWLL